MDDIQLPVGVIVVFLSTKTIIHCFNTLPEDRGVYFRLVLVALLNALVVRVDLFYQNKLGHVPIFFGPNVWYKDDLILLPVEVDPYMMMIGALSLSMTFQSLGGSCELIGLGYGTHVVDVTLQVLS